MCPARRCRNQSTLRSRLWTTHDTAVSHAVAALDSQLVGPHRVMACALAGTGRAFCHARSTNPHTRDTTTMRRFNRPGFTFIELLIVMVVMGVLAGIGVPRIRNMKERSYQAT